MKKELTPTTTKGELLQDKHTPLPWHIVEVIDSTGIISIASEKFGGICVIPHAGKHKPEHEANAELIVKAVNERQKLLDRIKFLEDLVKEYTDKMLQNLNQ